MSTDIIKTIDDRTLVLCFQIHQPFRLKKTTAGDLTGDAWYWRDEKLDQAIMERIAKTSYLPTNALLLRLIERYPEIRITFSISGTALEQMETFTPEVLSSFKALADTGAVDFLSETYYHSLAFLMDGEEFEIQILEHAEKMVELFGMRPTVFRNTGLIYNDDIGRRLSMMGFQGVLTEGNMQQLRNLCPHHLYEHRDENGLKIMLRNASLSDDIAFRVALKDWNITAERYLSWLETMPENENLVVISLDYETFGEHHKAETGIFQFLENLLLMLAIEKRYIMTTAATVVQRYAASKPVSIPDYIATTGSSLADWVGNQKQREAFTALIEPEAGIKSRNDATLLKHWRHLQASDHFYYMSDKADQGNTQLFASSQEAFDLYMHVLRTLRNRIYTHTEEQNDPEKINEAIEAERRHLNAPLWALNIGSRGSGL